MSVRYHYPVHRARNVFTAVALAEELRKAGEFDLFRGQVVNYPLRSTATRPGINPDEVLEKLNDFYSWVQQTPELSSLHKDPDLALAVAQHYGLPTPFMDFSLSPAVAGYFASHSNRSREDGPATSCIVCANSKLLVNSWQDLNERHRSCEGFDLVRLVKVDVKNLWRLQCQQGVFLDVRVDPTLLEMFSYFLHIEFPWSGDRRVGDDSKVYPVNKSHLEILLDQYFLIATYPQRQKQLDRMFDAKIEVYPEKFEGETSFFVENLLPPVHSSWENAAIGRWLEEPDERYTELPLPRTIIIETFAELPNREAFERISSFLATQLLDHQLRHSGSITWQVMNTVHSEIYIRDESVDSEEEVLLRVGQMVQLLFDGMRSKPYTDINICNAISLYVLLCSRGSWAVMESIFEHIEGIEFAGGFTRGRGFADRKLIKSAIRDDILEFVKPEKLAEVEQYGFMGVLVDPRRLFIFDKFCHLFAEQALPTAAKIMIEGKVLPFNPARIEAFGAS